MGCGRAAGRVLLAQDQGRGAGPLSLGPVGPSAELVAWRPDTNLQERSFTSDFWLQL